MTILLNTARRTSFFENVPIGVLVVHENQITYCNKHSGTLFDADRCALLGLRIEVVISPDSLAEGRPDKSAQAMYVHEPVKLNRLNGDRFLARMRWFPLGTERNRAFLVIVEEYASSEMSPCLGVLPSVITKGFAIVENRHFVYCSSLFSAITGHPIHAMEGACIRLIYPSEETYMESGKMFLGSLTRGTTSFSNQLVRRRTGEDVLCNIEIEPLNIKDPYAYTLWRVEASCIPFPNLERAAPLAHKAIA